MPNAFQERDGLWFLDFFLAYGLQNPLTVSAILTVLSCALTSLLFYVVDVHCR